MERIEISPRANWQGIVEEMGFTFHADYWDESAYYKFTSNQIDLIEEATNQLEQKCFGVINHVIDNNLFQKIGIPDVAARKITESWRARERNIYGRFDFGYDGEYLKLYEYNADTPTSVFEASVVQWQWLQSRFPTADQFNSIHERLIEAWRGLGLAGSTVHFAYFEENAEDTTTTLYLADTAYQAGLQINALDISAIGSDGKEFYDLDNQQINVLFKLYPWEMMWKDEFASTINTSHAQFIEPAWKSILSNKALLPLLWKLNPGDPFLLPASFDAAELEGEVVRKPFFSREGANIATGRIVAGKFVSNFETDGPYEGPYIYQQKFNPRRFTVQGKSIEPVIGSWVIASQSAGIGIREDSGTTTNMSHFVPHLFV